jgi:hypothetical protein
MRFSLLFGLIYIGSQIAELTAKELKYGTGFTYFVAFTLVLMLLFDVIELYIKGVKK